MCASLYFKVIDVLAVSFRLGPRLVREPRDQPTLATLRELLRVVAGRSDEASDACYLSADGWVCRGHRYLPLARERRMSISWIA